MPSSYPGAADSFGAPAASDPQSTPVGGRTHSQSHTDLGDAVEAIEAELGLNPSGAAATVAARLDAHDASTTPHIPAGAVSGSGAVGAVKWDESVGRRCFAWDTVNSRWQMIYGDTGVRDVAASSTLPGDTTIAALKVRRIGNTVEFVAWFTPGATLQAIDRRGIRSMYALPSGFRPSMNGSQYDALPAGALGTGDQTRFLMLGTPTDGTTLYFWATGDAASTNWTAVTHILRRIWTTNDPWPTVLPGTAAGSIPDA